MKVRLGGTPSFFLHECFTVFMGRFCLSRNPSVYYSVSAGPLGPPRRPCSLGSAPGVRPDHPGHSPCLSPPLPAWPGQACPSRRDHITGLALCLHSPEGLESLAGLEIPRERSEEQCAVSPSLTAQVERVAG
jgi:hypothetical protein